VKPVRFAVESVAVFGGRRVIFARRLDPGDFNLAEGLWLSGYRVLTFDIPRAVAADGAGRLDVFAFTLRIGDGTEIAPGQLVFVETRN